MKKVVAIVLIIIAIMSGAVFALFKGGVFSPKDKESEVATEDTALAPEGQGEDSSSFTIDPNDPLYDLKLSLRVDVSKEDLSKYEEELTKLFNDISMPSRNEERTTAASKVGWGKEGYHMYDAISDPFSTVEAGKTKYTEEETEKMYQELRQEIADNPIVGMMILEGWEYMELTDGTTVLDLNGDWVKEKLDLYDQYGVGVWLTYHTKYWEIYGFELPHDGQDVDEWKAAHPNAPQATEELMAFVTDDEGSYQLFITDEETAVPGVGNNYDEVRKKILMWFDRVTCEGVETYKTNVFWYLNSTTTANDVKAVRNEDKNRYDALPALIFSVIVKDDNGTRQILFGFNIYDKRLEIFERTAKPVSAEKPSPQGKDDTNPPGPTGKTDTNPPSPSGGSDGSNPPGPGGHDNPDPVNPDPQKDSHDSSAQQGNAQTGGGNGQGGTGAPVEDPSKNDMQDAQGGSDQNQGHSNPETVTSETPTSETHDTSDSGINGQNVSEDDHNESTVENTNETKQDYGEESGAKGNDDVSGGDGDMGNDTNGEAMSEPGV